MRGWVCWQTSAAIATSGSNLGQIDFVKQDASFLSCGITVDAASTQNTPKQLLWLFRALHKY